MSDDSDQSTDGTKRNPRAVRPLAFNYPKLKRKSLRSWIRADHAVPEANPPPIHIRPRETGTDHSEVDDA